MAQPTLLVATLQINKAGSASALIVVLLAILPMYSLFFFFPLTQLTSHTGLTDVEDPLHPAPISRTPALNELDKER
ncbi:hypothetical protein B0H14DRAFT_2936903 [Mycena olivaceomarginata]|nr:hypothetical protein B0H14DRAFT_3070254 [Mycena olivaceomarginata]KAJ7692508.1 hypothetical protein B0H14DRAFT_3046345 [Mycena olivaceomarginata]KAJ7791136.1 hypothetical protein B0H14DRAFT_2936903 [Mycena olivaceomarginata]